MWKSVQRPLTHVLFQLTGNYTGGEGNFGQLGQGNNNPIGRYAGEMSALSPIDIVGKSELVALGAHSTCTVTTNNHVYCWGSSGTSSQAGVTTLGALPNDMGTNLLPVPMIMTPYDTR